MIRHKKCFVLFVLFLLLSSQLLVFEFGLIPTVKANPTLEDFTTFTEVDPNGHLSKNATHVDHKGYRNEDCYLNKSYGANHFGDFTHLINLKPVGHGATNYGASYFWMLSVDTVDDFNGLTTASKTGIGVTDWYLAGTGKGHYISVEETYLGTRYTASALYLTEGTQYYLTIIKSGTNLTANVYTNSARTTLLGTRSLTLHADHKCKYIFAGNTYNDGTDTNKWVDVDIDNLDLQEGANQAPSINSLRLSSITDTVNITSVNANTWMDWEANITDADTLNDLKNVTIRVERNATWDKQGIVISESGKGVMEPSVIYDSSPQILTGNVFKLWYGAFATGSYLVYYAESANGIDWTKYSGNPVLNTREKTVRPYVLKNGATYFMYVMGGTTEQAYDRWNSTNGLSWQKDKDNTLTIGSGWDGNNLGNPCVWVEGSSWKMLYEACGTKWQIGLATSSDGKTWTKSGSNPVLSGTGSCGGPHCFKIGSTYYLWFHEAPSGGLPTDICRASSTDLITWTHYGGDYYPVFPRTKTWEGVGSSTGQVADAHLVEALNKTWIYYTATPNQTLSSFKIACAYTTYSMSDLVKTAENAVHNIAQDTPVYNEKAEYWFRYLNSTNSWQWYNGTSWTSTSSWLNTSACSYPTKTGTNGWYLFRIKLSSNAQNATNWEFEALVYDSALHTATRKFSKITVNALAGQTYTRPANQTVSVSPTVTRIGSFQRSLTLIFQFFGTATRTVTFMRQVLQLGTIQAVASRLETFARTLAEPFSLLASSTRMLAIVRQSFQSVTLTTFISRITTLFRTSTMISQVSVFTTAQRTVARVPTLTLTPSAIAERVLQSQRSTSQLIQLLASVERTASLPRQTMQTLILNFIQARTLTTTRSSISVLNIVSQATRNLMATRQQPISFLITALANRVATFQRQATQLFSLSSFPIRTVDILRLPTQQLSLFMETVATRTFGRPVSESIFTQFLAARTQTLQRVTSALVQILSSNQRTASFARSLSQPFSIFVANLRSLTGARQASQAFTLIPSTIRTLFAQRQIFQAFSISGLTSRLATLSRTQIQQFTLALSISRTQAFARLVSETLTSQTSTLRLQALFRQGNILFQIMSTAIGEKAGFYERLISQVFLILPSASRSLIGSRQATQQFLLLAFTSRTMQPTRQISQTLQILSQALRNVQTARTSVTSMTLTFEALRSLELPRASLEAFTMIAQVDRLLGASRTVVSQFSIILSVASERIAYGILRSADFTVIVRAVAQRTHVGMTRTANALFQAIVTVSSQAYPLTEGYISGGPISTPNFEILIDSITYDMNTLANQLTVKAIVKFQPLDAFNGNVTLQYWISDYSGTTRLAGKNMTIQTHSTDRDSRLYTLSLSTSIFWTCITNNHLIFHLNAEYNGVTTNEIRVLFTPFPLLTQLRPFSVYFLMIGILLVCYWLFFIEDGHIRKQKAVTKAQHYKHL